MRFRPLGDVAAAAVVIVILMVSSLNDYVAAVILVYRANNPRTILRGTSRNT